MTRILFAWEMGANFGHVNKISQVAQELEDEVELTVAARNVIAVRDLAPDLKARLLPAPHSPPRMPRKNEHYGQSPSGVLLMEGWDRPQRLIALMEAWRALFDLVQPEVLVAQAAPTAMLAARGAGFKTAVLGSGYDAPPRAHPMPCFTPDKPEAVKIAEAQEEEALSNANAALSHYGLSSMREFRELFEVDRYILVSYPESDHFYPREKIEPNHPPYLGQLLSVSNGTELRWEGREVPKIFAYLRPGSEPYAAGIHALAAIGRQAEIILAAPGIDPTESAKLRERGVHVCDGPVRLDHILGDCDLGLSHGTNGIGSAFIAYGVPQIALPTHNEQAMFSRTVARAGMGLGIAGKYGAKQVVEAINKARAQPRLRTRCREVRDGLVEKGLDRPAQAAAQILRELAGI